MAAGSGVGLAGCGSRNLMMPPVSTATDAQMVATIYDTIVVGSGMAGLTAAQKLSSNGRSVLVLEGRNRIGGRTYTDTTTFGVPLDIGAQWLHQGSSNPLLKIAKHRGIAKLQSEAEFYDGTRRVTDYRELALPGSQIVAQELAVNAVGKAATLGAKDESLWQATKALRTQPYFGWYKTAEALFGPEENGVEYPDLSCEDQYNWNKESLDDEESMVAGGMGTFVASFAKGLTIRLSTPVTAIRYGGSGSVQVVTPRGIYRSRTVITTTPIGGLLADIVAFDPPLPKTYRDAISYLPMGTFEKIAIGFKRQVFDTPINTEIFPYLNRVDIPILYVRLWGGSVGICIVGGDLALSLRKKGSTDSTAMIKYAQRQLAAHFAISSADISQSRGLASDWLNDYWTRGSYSAALPGHDDARTALAAPLHEKVFFAGEALSVDHPGSVAGAYVTGNSAANRVHSALA